MKDIQDTKSYLLSKLTSYAGQYGLVLRHRGGNQFLIKNKWTRKLYVQCHFDCLAEEIDRFKGLGRKYVSFFETILLNDGAGKELSWTMENGDKVYIFESSWRILKPNEKRKNRVSQALLFKKGYLQQIIEEERAPSIETVRLYIDPIEEGYKQIKQHKSYYINKYGDVIRKTVNGFKPVETRRSVSVASIGPKGATVIDVDEQVNNLFFN